MILRKRLITPLATSLVAALFLSNLTFAQDGQEVKVTESAAVVADDKKEDPTVQSVEEEVRGSAEDEAAKRRKKLVEDAVEALDETQKALSALDKGDTEAALEALAIANGKLDLVVLRNPRLALAPVDNRVVTYDLFATVESIDAAKKRALKYMKEGRLQEARSLIENLRSEVVIEVVNVPLATYPAAIRAIAPLLDEGKVEEAKTALQRALNTLVVVEHSHALPVIRAKHMLTRAEGLAETTERSDEEADELTSLIEGARRQLELAEALGYGHVDDFAGYYEQLDEIAGKTSDGKSGTGFFDKIRAALRSFGESASGTT